MPQQSAAEYGGLGRSIYFFTPVCGTQLEGRTGTDAISLKTDAIGTGFNDIFLPTRFLLHLLVLPHKQSTALHSSLVL
jgi:hypothetical protein